MRHEALQLSAGAACTDTAVILPLGGQRLLGEVVTPLMLASGNECGDKPASDAGAFFTPSAAARPRRRPRSLAASSHSKRRSLIMASRAATILLSYTSKLG